MDLLDDFREISGWIAVASGQAELALALDEGPHGNSLRLDFDFHGGGGFVVARKGFRRRLPASFAFSVGVRGVAPANRFELKLADPAGTSVWWFHRDAFTFPAQWQPLRIASREIEFAYGPAGGGPMRELGAIELAIAAGPGGRGTLWFADLGFEDLEPRVPPVVSASSAARGHSPEAVLEASTATSWRSEGADRAQWLAIDFQAERELGGLVIDWEAGREARAFDVAASTDGTVWKTHHSARQAEGRRSYVYLPGMTARFVRIELRESADAGFGIVHLEARPESFSRSLPAFFHEIAAGEPRGLYPRWLCREQSYWTPVGVDGGTTTALLDEQGMLEVDRGSFSIEPFVFVDGRLVTWADASLTQELLEGWIPIPSSVWRFGDLRLTTTAFAAPGDPGPVLFARYRLENAGDRTRALALFAVIRPFQVTPPWQSFGELGGPSPIRTLEWRDGALWVNGERPVVPLTPPDGTGVASFEQGGVMPSLLEGGLPVRERVDDEFAHASAALRFDLELPSGAARDFVLAIPFGRHDPARTDIAALRRAAQLATPEAEGARWKRRLGRVTLRVPEPAREAVLAMRTAAAHVLLNRDGPALQPGPRRYTRSWIRDAATMAAALLRLGAADAVRDFLRWYTPNQKEDGNVPCSVDANGPDWLPEHDSHGQLAFTVAEHLRITGERTLASELWPAVSRATAYLAALRGTRLTPEFEAGERRACYGILPESASHEGYLAHPVHAYWDDFWALRGLADAAELAGMQGDAEAADRLLHQHDELRDCVYASIQATIAQRDIRYVPGSVEWADFDPAATATAISTTDAAERLPQQELRFTFDEYLAGFRRRARGEIEWANYTAYEIRIIGALVRLGRRDEAHELLEFFLADRRPRAWNQWPEISWRDPRSPGHLGDLPHTWIAAEFVLAVLGLFAYEDPTRRGLVVAAGIPEAWLDEGEPIVVDDLPTWFGPLGYRLRRLDAGTLELSLRGELRPPGGIWLRPPLSRPIGAVLLDGAPAPFLPDRVMVPGSPATVRITT